MVDQNTNACLKRFIELYFGDPEFTIDYNKNPLKVLGRYELPLDYKHLETVKDLLIMSHGELHEVISNPYIRLILEKSEKAKKNMERIINFQQLSNLKFRTWFMRQNNHLKYTSRHRREIFDYLSPFVYELSSGCSVQCPFCTLSPDRLSGTLAFTAESRQEWRDILDYGKKMSGTFMELGLCYFATEPLDNPDYLQFLRVFHEQIGLWPQTTTARSLQNLDTIKELISLCTTEDLERGAIRFSITRKKDIERIHRAFSPKEMEHIDLVLNNPESSYHYTRGGRARNLIDKLPEEKFVSSMTSSCVTGFVTNLLDKTITLMVPETAGEHFPLGLDIYETVHYEDADDYRNKIDQLIEKWMFVQIPENRILSFHPLVSIRKEDLGIRFQGDGVSRIMGGNNSFYAAIDLIATGRFTLSEITGQLSLLEFEIIYLKSKLDRLFTWGLFNEHYLY